VGAGKEARVPYVAVVGPGEASPPEIETAEAVGLELAAQEAILVCGGLGGVMAAACRGAAAAGGVSVGILPGSDRASANEWATIAIPTGLGELRNGLVVRAADAVISVGGGHGTLSEIALALKTGVKVIGLDSWNIAGVQPAEDPRDAVRQALGRVPD
jgi:uncharacterized protein (TIGR00725 family)